MLVEAILFFSFLLLYWFYKNRLPSDYPPTPPFRLPFFGHIIHIIFHGGGNTHDFLLSMYKKYSKDGMLAMHQGKEKVVLIGDHKVMREALKAEETNYRIADLEQYLTKKRERIMPEYAKGNEGIIFNQGERWLEQRRFTQSTLRDFGFGKASMGELINEEFDHFRLHITNVAKANNGIVTIQHFFNIAVLNMLWKIIHGERFEYTDPKMLGLVGNMFFVCCAPQEAYIFRKLPFLKPIYKTLGIAPPPECKKPPSNTKKIRDFIEENIKKHKEDFDPANIRDFIDSYLLHMQKTEDPNSSFFGQQANEQLVNVLGDLFLAGTEPASNTLTWGTLYFVRNTDTQQKMREEIKRVVGNDRSPTIEDREKMPYTEATIMEIQRIADMAPSALPHATQEKGLKVGSYTIPKRHRVIPLLTSVSQSEELWDKPLEFRPERHLDKDGQVIRSEFWIPFGTGRRRCLGELLAKVELFLFFTRLIQGFNFEPVDPINPPPIEATVRITRSPKPFEIRLTPLF